MHRRRAAAAWAALATALLLAGCASAPGGRDGPEARPPAGLERVPDAVPRVEPLRQGGPNKPYTVLGRSYVPMTADLPLAERGLASWYGRKFHGRPTASGEIYDMYAMTAAHPTMPIPSYARVRNPANGREVIVRVNDRGPFADGRVIDLSYTAALRLDLLRGVAPVEVRRLTHAEIRAGVSTPAVAAAPAAASMEGTAGIVADDLAPGDDTAGGFWLQLGAFRQRDGAERELARLRGADDELPLRLLAEDGLFRLHAGPWPSRAAAEQAARRLRARHGLETLLLERR